MERSLFWWGTFLALLVLISLASAVFIGFWCLVVLAAALITFFVALWSSRLVVPENWNYIFEWNGEALDPLEPGMYFPFPWLGFLKAKGMVPMNRQTLRVLSGERKGCPEDIIKKYPYGADSNIEPASGDEFKALYHVETQCTDSKKFAYAYDDTYSYVVSLIESRVRNFLGSKTGEDVSDKFSSYPWKIEVLDSVYGGNSLSYYIEENFGLKIIEILSIDIILTPEVEEFRRKLDESSRKKEIYEVEAEAADARKKLQAKNDEITKNTISVIKNTAGVNGNKALDYMTSNKKLETMETVSKNGANTFIDGAGGGSFVGGTGFGWGFNSQNKSKLNSDGKAENDEKKDDKKLEVKKPEKNK